MSKVEWWESLLQTLSFLTATWAAHLWFRASRVELPPHSGDSWEGRGPFMDALNKQSRMNARAALTAAVAALLQGLAIAAKVIGPLTGLP